MVSCRFGSLTLASAGDWLAGGKSAAETTRSALLAQRPACLSWAAPRLNEIDSLAYGDARPIAQLILLAMGAAIGEGIGWVAQRLDDGRTGGQGRGPSSALARRKPKCGPVLGDVRRCAGMALTLTSPGLQREPRQWS
ncbi:hypothetical protein JDV02_005829 [Purpureocillium takamizusanense]|uniref:Uncharacterized protein n=1 Tax=Purpureocillium takamizusanense TaxID=2060973 RepID=A0A9Q8VAQ6_9HYPO|nr:uncharacterized protein JDV02_005829 [Purpureocillium takamizusanense]UNI19655.1 hypothetical protein JDV02_005829 [Purpureocillium takamizusanense]